MGPIAFVSNFYKQEAKKRKVRKKRKKRKEKTNSTICSLKTQITTALEGGAVCMKRTTY